MPGPQIKAKSQLAFTLPRGAFPEQQGQALRENPRIDEGQLGWDGCTEERISSSKKKA